MMWHLVSAANLIKFYQSDAQEAGWDLYLGGEVLTKGESNFPLEMLVVPAWRGGYYRSGSVRQFVHSLQMRGLEFKVMHRMQNRMHVEMELSGREIYFTFINFADEFIESPESVQYAAILPEPWQVDPKAFWPTQTNAERQCP